MQSAWEGVVRDRATTPTPSGRPAAPLPPLVVQGYNILEWVDEAVELQSKLTGVRHEVS